jgi:hypothetical protein
MVSACEEHGFPVQDANLSDRIPNLIFEFIAFTLALFKTVQHVTEMYRPPTSPTGDEISKKRSGLKPLGQRLIEGMFADSLLYFSW